MQEGHSDLLCPPESRKEISPVRGRLPVPGEQKASLSAETGSSRLRKPYKSALSLGSFTTRSPHALVLSILHKSVVSLSKKYKSSLIFL